MFRVDDDSKRFKSPPLGSFYGIAGKAAWTKLPLSAARHVHGDETPTGGEIADDFFCLLWMNFSVVWWFSSPTI